MRTVDHDADVEVGQGRIERLPQRVRDAMGDLAGAAKEGLLALSVGVGLGVLHELMEAELDEVVGPKGKHNLDRRSSPCPRRPGGRRWMPTASRARTATSPSSPTRWS